MELINAGSARFRIHFESGVIPPAALMAGLSFFLLMAYYFGVVDFGLLNALEVIFSMFLLLLITAAFMILLQGIHYPAVPLYGIMGCVLCLVLIIRACLFGSTLNIVFAFIWYIPTALICLGTTFSYLATPNLMAAAYIIAAAVRIVVIDLLDHLLKLDILGSLPSFAASFALLAFGLFALSLKMHTPKRKKI